MRRLHVKTEQISELGFTLGGYLAVNIFQKIIKNNILATERDNILAVKSGGSMLTGALLMAFSNSFRNLTGKVRYLRKFC